MRLTNAWMMHLFDSSPRRMRGDGSTQKRHEKRAERIGPFYAVLNKGLSAKAAGQALKSGHRRQPFNPFGAPVGWAVWGFCSSRGAAGRIALVFSCLFEGIGIAATAALHAIEFFARAQLFTFVTTGQMPVDVEMDDHEMSPS